MLIRFQIYSDCKSQEGPSTYQEWRPLWQKHGQERRKRNRSGAKGPALAVTLTDKVVFVLLMLPLKLRTPATFITIHARVFSGSVVSSSLQPTNCSLPASSVHGILQASIMEWVAISSSSRGSSQPRDQTPGLLHCRQILYLLSHRGSPYHAWLTPL